MHLRAYVGFGIFCTVLGCLGSFLGDAILNSHFYLKQKNPVVAQLQISYPAPTPAPGIAIPAPPPTDQTPDLPPLSTLRAPPPDPIPVHAIVPASKQSSDEIDQ